MRRIGGWWDEGGRKRTTETLSLYAEGEASRGGWCGGVKTVTSLASRRYRFLETMPQAPFMHASVHVCVRVYTHACTLRLLLEVFCLAVFFPVSRESAVKVN